MRRLGLSSTLARSIQGAIERLDNGSFGLCLKCEDNIAPKRLNALLWAELCIRCQEEADRSDCDQVPTRTIIDEAEAAQNSPPPTCEEPGDFRVLSPWPRVAA